MYFAIGLGESTGVVAPTGQAARAGPTQLEVGDWAAGCRIELIGYGIVFGGYAALTSALIAQVCTSADGGAQAAFA